MNRKTVAAAVSVDVLGFAATSANAAIAVSVGGMAFARQGQTSNFNGQAGYTAYDFNLDTLDGLPTSCTGNGRVVIGSLGGQYANPHRPDAPDTSQYLSVPSRVSGAGSEFDTVVLRSARMALESDNHVFGTAVVPVPGAAALLMSGMLFAARRQRKGLQVA